MRTLFVSLALVYLPAHSQQAGGDSYEWRPQEGEPSKAYLYHAGQLAGAWDGENQTFRACRYVTERSGFLGKQMTTRLVWSDPSEPPISPPLELGQRRPGPIEPIGQNFGLDMKQSSMAQGYYHKDRATSRQHVYESVSKSVPDDSGKPRVTVTGSSDQRQRFRNDWYTSPEAADVRNKALLWDVPPDHWSLRDNVNGTAMFDIAGNPTIYCQAPDGRVLHRQADYRGPDDFQALRRAIDDYQSKKDPDRRNMLNGGGITVTTPWLIGIGAFLAVVLTFAFRQQIASFFGSIRAAVTPAPRPDPVNEQLKILIEMLGRNAAQEKPRPAQPVSSPQT